MLATILVSISRVDHSCCLEASGLLRMYVDSKLLILASISVCCAGLRL